MRLQWIVGIFSLLVHTQTHNFLGYQTSYNLQKDQSDEIMEREVPHHHTVFPEALSVLH